MTDPIAKDPEASAQDIAFEALLKEATKDVVALTSNSILLNGRFIIRRRLGSGGMGVVYEARDNAQDGRVALKVLSEVNPSSIYRLKQEFRALADVHHPNLVVLHELFADKNDIWFFTMEMVVGQSLVAHMNVAFDPVRLKQIFLELAEGIHAIHKAGKLHRDLKPTNVLVTPKGHVKILDFGLVSDEELGGVGQTVLSDGVSGTPIYMAPEQAAGEPSVRGTDWYAFGVMLFEVLTGRLPFEDSPHQVIHRKQEEDAPLASSVSSGVPEDLDVLCRDLLRRDPAKRPSFRTIAKVLGGQPLTFTGALDEAVPFVGRERELEMLASAFADTDQSKPVIVLVDGPSGIGKSTLIERFLNRVEAEDDVVVLKGRCYERESVPFKACDSLIDDLTHYLRRLPTQHAGRLMPRHVSALARIFPVVNRLEVVRETRERFRLPPNPNELRLIAFSAAKELLSRITAQDPLVLFVDDLQWSDVDGIKMLTSLVAAPDPPSLMLIGAFRSEDATGSTGLNLLRERIAGMREADVRHIHLSKLDDEEACRLAGVLLPEEASAYVREIAREAEGSPFFITELSRFAKIDVSPNTKSHLERAIEHRVSGLSPRAKELMGFIAVSGRPTESGLLEVAMNQGNIAGPLRSLEAFNLIRQTGGPVNRVACYHDRIRDTVLSRLDDAQIKALHQRLADALEIEKNPDSVVLTEHLLGAHAFDKAAQTAIKAARQAEESLAFENAAKFYRIALDSWRFSREEECRIQHALGEALAHAGRGAEAATAYMAAAEDAPPEESLNLRCQAAQQWIRTGHMGKGTAELNKVLNAVGLGLYGSQRRIILAIIKNRALLKLAFSKEHRTRPGPLSGRQLLELRACEATVLGLWATDTLQSVAFCSRYLRKALHAGIRADMIKALCTEATFRVADGAKSYATADRYLKYAESLCEDVRDAETHAYRKLAYGMIDFSKGNLREAVDHLEETERFCLESCTRKMTTLEMCQVFLGASYTRIGRWGALQQAWDRWIAAAEETGNLHHLSVCRMWFMGSVRWLAIDRADTAKQQLDESIREWSWPDFNMLRLNTHLSRAYIHLYQDEGAEAYRLCSDLMTRMRSHHLMRLKFLRVYYTTDLIYCALALLAKTPSDQALFTAVQRLIASLEREQTEFGIPYLTFFHGALSHIQGDVETAVPLLQESIVAFEEMGYALHAAALRRRLGKIIGGDEGRSLIDSGIAAMNAEQIVNPEGTTNLIAPGFAD